MEYIVIIERGENGFGAYVPDLPGCIAAGDTQEEVRQLIEEAIRLHVDDLKEQGVAIPLPTSSTAIVRVA